VTECPSGTDVGRARLYGLHGHRAERLRPSVQGLPV